MARKSLLPPNGAHRAGGLARAKVLSPRRRKEIAKQAAHARWQRTPPKLRKRRLSFRVSLLLPDGATVQDVKDYVEAAVQDWSGQFRPPGGYGPDDPGDPLWRIGDTARVTKLRT